MASGQNSWTVQIPVDPMTHELGLTLRGIPGPGPDHLPIIGPMSLLDHSGDVLAQIDPFASSPSGGLNEAVTVSLQDVPAGGVLLVQLSTPIGATAGSSILSTGRTPPAPWSDTFEMDVQRIESAVSSSTAEIDTGSGSIPVSGGSLIGTLAGGAGSTTPEWSSSGSLSSDPVAPMEATVVPDVESLDPPGQAMTEDGSADEPPARIAVGPLASRAAAPIGPNLSRLEVDPAPAIDRHERALADAMVSNTLHRLAADPTATSHDPNEERGAGIERDGLNRPPQGSDSVGLGPLRLMASRTRGIDRRGSLDALYAAMGPAGTTGTIRAVMEADPTDQNHVLLAFAAPDSSDADQRLTPNYLTSACFVALGMGLIARPIIPDLLRLLPSRASRWGRRPIPPTPSSPGATPGRRSFGSWFRRRLDAPVRPLPTV